MTHVLLPSGMLRTTEDAGPRTRLEWPTAPIGALWAPWWPLPRTPVAPPLPPPPKSLEDEECGCDVQDATTRPRDMEHGAQQYKGKRMTVADVPPYQLAPVDPWARRPEATS